jgi:diphthamide synthase (EF-2-diphthine--ammonia ligase)
MNHRLRLFIAGSSAPTRPRLSPLRSALIVCLDPTKLDPTFAGRRFDGELLADLPAGVDPCGENSEFHTFVHTGPVFTEQIACETGEVVERDGFVFCDVLP